MIKIKSESVTETPVTKRPRVTKTLRETVAKIGRPRKPNALTGAQKQKAYRERKRG